VLVVDNGGRADEACVGDLVVLEAQAAGLGGVVMWGLHRDTPEVTQIGLPVFSYGQTLRQQTAFGEYLARRAAEPSYTFRRHLRQIGEAIEE
jgi:regulator of RNase E activity RraA